MTLDQTFALLILPLLIVLIGWFAPSLLKGRVSRRQPAPEAKQTVATEASDDRPVLSSAAYAASQRIGDELKPLIEIAAQNDLPLLSYLLGMAHVEATSRQEAGEPVDQTTRSPHMSIVRYHTEVTSVLA